MDGVGPVASVGFMLERTCSYILVGGGKFFSPLMCRFFWISVGSLSADDWVCIFVV